MFGFSLGKLIVLVVVVLAVVYGFRWIGALDRERRRKVRRETDRDSGAANAPEEMVKCPVCSTFVSARAASGCGRNDCPYGR